MARLWLLSDLHLESLRYPDQLVIARPEFDVLVCAGDVWGGEPERAVDKVADLAGGRPSILVLGNHEPWNLTVSGALGRAKRRAAKRGVRLLAREETEVAGVRFAGATLWTDLRLGREEGQPIRQSEPILRRDGSGKKIDVDDVRAEHALDRDWLAERRRADCPLVVVTHHPPLPECSDVPLARAAFVASDLSDVVAGVGADVWIHGHVHRSLDFVSATGTRVVCNAFGAGGMNLDFVDDLVVEV